MKRRERTILPLDAHLIEGGNTDEEKDISTKCGRGKRGLGSESGWPPGAVSWAPHPSIRKGQNRREHAQRTSADLRGSEWAGWGRLGRTPEYTHGGRPGKSGFGAHLSVFFLGLWPPNSSVFWNGLLGPPGFIRFPVTASKNGNKIGKNPIFSSGPHRRCVARLQ